MVEYRILIHTKRLTELTFVLDRVRIGTNHRFIAVLATFSIISTYDHSSCSLKVY